MDIALVRGSNDRLPGERNDRVAEFRATFLEIGTRRGVDAILRMSTLESAFHFGLPLGFLSLLIGLNLGC